MKIRYAILLTLTAVLLASTSCVSTKKYEEMRLAKEYWEGEADAIDSLRQKYRALEEEARATDIQLTDAFQDLERLTATNRNLKRNYEEILSRYNELLTQNQRVVSVSSEERQELTEQLAEKQAALDQKERELRQREARLDSGNPQGYGYNQGNITQTLQNQLTTLNQLRSALMQALRGVNSAQLTISERGGKIYVAMNEDLLFPNGQEQISTQGQQAIQQLVRVLSSYPSINVLVEGHTDTDGSAAYNWDTSVLRATTVVKSMIEAGADPTRITAAGRGFYYPLASNVTEAGKARNRRVEVVLSPDTERIYSALNN